MDTICDVCGRPVQHRYPSGEYGRKSHTVKAKVVYDFYGCDTGCDGYSVIGYDCNGRELSRDFYFEHFYNGEDEDDFIKRMMTMSYGEHNNVEVIKEACNVHEAY